ncbi:MAG: hypothetical protein JO001_20520 [Alphaproteobacteria bacterium]|nr:hypothetical protein [Alphaproteobacteria bacterium]
MSDPDIFALGGQQGTEALRQRRRALIRELIEVSYLLLPSAAACPGTPPAPPATRPEATPAENEALRVECEAIAAELRAPLPDGDAGLITALQRWHDMQPRMRLSDRGFNVTVDNECEIIEPIAYEAENELSDRIEETPAKGLPGVLIKLRFLAGKRGIFADDYMDIFGQLAEVVAAACHQRGWHAGRSGRRLRTLGNPPSSSDVLAPVSDGRGFFWRMSKAMLKPQLRPRGCATAMLQLTDASLCS